MNLGVTKTLVEDCYSLNVSEARVAFERGPDPRGWAKLHELDPWDLSNPPWRETYHMTAQGPIYSNEPFGAPVTIKAWHLDYGERFLAIQIPGGHIEEVGWEEQPWRFGGVRRWWLCPGCGRRCSKLYSRPRWSSGLDCRCCLRLAYTVENESKINRSIGQYWRQANRHGIRNGTLSSFFCRPRGQHFETYMRERSRLDALEHRMVMAIYGIQRCRI